MQKTKKEDKVLVHPQPLRVDGESSIKSQSRRKDSAEMMQGRKPIEQGITYHGGNWKNPQ